MKKYPMQYQKVQAGMNLIIIIIIIIIIILNSQY